MTAATASSIQYLNLAYFGRPSDPAALDAFPASGLSQEQIVASFVTTAEYSTNTIVPNSIANPGGGRTYDTTSLINTFYQRLVGRLASATEVSGWSTALATGNVNEDYLGITILTAWLNLPAATPDRQVLVAKFDSAQLWSGDLYNDPASANAYSTTAAVNSGIAFNNGITTATPATSVEVAAAVDTMVADSGAAAGQGFTLTTTTDQVTGNFSSITGTKVGAAGAGTTLNVFDTINVSPANGVATANINLAATAVAIAAANTPVLNGVTTINFTNSNAGTSITGGVTPSATTINFTSVGAGANAITVGAAAATGILAPVTTLGLSSLNTAASNYLVNFVTGTRNTTTDAITFNSSNNVTATGTTVGTVTFTGGAAGEGIETVNVVLTGNNVFTSLISNDTGAAVRLDTLNLSGTGDLDVSANALTFRGATSTINASTLTGSFDLGVAGATATAVTGGAGNDTIRFGAGLLTAADTIDLGTGTNKVVLSENVGTAATAGLNTVVNAITTAQVIGLFGSSTIDFSGITATQFSAEATAGAETYVVLSNSATDKVIVQGGGNAITAITANGGLGFNTLNVDFEGNAAGAVALTTLGVNAQSTVNIVSNGSTGTNTITNFTNVANASINVTGARALNLGTMAAASAINAGSFTGALTVVGSAAASSITGGSANDTITGAAGADTITGGAGADTIATGATVANGMSIVGGLGADLVTVTARGAAATTTGTYAATAAESFATAASFDTLTFADGAAGENYTLTTATGLNSASLATATTVTVGTTTITAGGYLVVRAGGLGAAIGDGSLYQDSNSDGIVGATDYRLDFVSAGAADTIAFANVGGQITIGMVGV